MRSDSESGAGSRLYRARNFLMPMSRPPRSGAENQGREEHGTQSGRCAPMSTSATVVDSTAGSIDPGP